jgi:DNA-binding transcriptional MocR family regulator
VRAKRADAARRQKLVAERLRGSAVRADPRAYYAWWHLPEPWRADTFTAAAALRGIAVTPGPSFAAAAAGASGAAAHIRLGLASAPVEALDQALRTLAALAHEGPREAGLG